MKSLSDICLAIVKPYGNEDIRIKEVLSSIGLFPSRPISQYAVRALVYRISVHRRFIMCLTNEALTNALSREILAYYERTYVWENLIDDPDLRDTLGRLGAILFHIGGLYVIIATAPSISVSMDHGQCLVRFKGGSWREKSGQLEIYDQNAIFQGPGHDSCETINAGRAGITLISGLHQYPGIPQKQWIDHISPIIRDCPSVEDTS